MKKAIPHLLLPLSLIPFALELPYCFSAMRVSPAERFNWCFLIAAFLLVIFIGPKLVEQGFPKVNFKPLKWLVVIPPLALWLFGLVRNIHLATLLGGGLLPCAIVYCIYGWRELFLLSPAFGVLLLSIPNIGLLLSSVLGFDGILIKTIFALVLAAIIPILYVLRNPIPKPSTAFFCALALLVAFAYLAGGHYSASLCSPTIPDFDKLISEEFRGIRQSDTSQYKNFYGDSDIRQFNFTDKAGNVANILLVSKIQNIHNVHPTTFCIRVGGYAILSEQTMHIKQDGQHQAFDVQEIIAEKNGRKHIFWQWYSTPDKSTASFLLFRTLYSSQGNWTAFLVDAPVNATAEDARNMLQSLIRGFQD